MTSIQFIIKIWVLIQCRYNYNISDIVQDLKGPIGVALSYSQYSYNESLSQSTIDMSEEWIKEFNHNSFCSKNESYRPKCKDVWKELNPVFRETVSTLEGNCTFDDLKEIKDYMIDIIDS